MFQHHTSARARFGLGLVLLVILLGGLTPALAQVLPPMSDPSPGSILTTTTVTFTGGHAAQPGEQHWLTVETAPFATDIFHKSLGMGHTAEVTGLPTSGTLYVRYWTYTPVAGWGNQAHTYTMAVASVEWERILGVIVPGIGAGGANIVAGVPSVGLSWAVTRGEAKVNLETGRIHFDVKGLVLRAAPAPPAVIGIPSPLVTMVKGTVVCNSTGAVVLVDTGVVPLSAQGEAAFDGTVSLPTVCENVAFLIRVADSNMLFDHWIAHGAVRKP